MSSAAPHLSHWLRASAAQHPQRCALRMEDEQLSYAELLERTQQLASKLRAANLATGDRIAIAAVRSIESIVAILAVIEAGLAYVPLDLSYPAGRLTAMLEDAAPRMVLGGSEALALLRAAVGDFPTLDNPAPPVDTAASIAGDEPSYVLFTSGSTGRPKGVSMGALPLRGLIHWHSQHVRLGKAATTLQFAPLSFDVHFQEIFSTLACAGTLILLPESQRRDPSLLLKALIEYGVERIFVPYVALQMIADASQEQLPIKLRDVVSAGEQLQVTPAIRSMFLRLTDAQLHNQYGPTESHVVSAFELVGDAAQWPDLPSIGKPLPHARMEISKAQVDPETGLTTGELVLGGDCLAIGYLGRPELTSERFRSDIPGLEGRWYATGDLVRREPDGAFTYLGRIDQQVKVDGFRIEIGEIELAIMAFAAIKDAAVSAPDIPGVGKQLVAHIVLKDAANADVNTLTIALRAHLRSCLPEYMVPARFLTLPTLPTTPSGKIDRRALPLPPTEVVTTGASTPLETVRAVWSDLLGSAEIADDQNLFDAGARSLLVMRFVARMKTLGFKTISVADVYDRPTIAGIAGGLNGSSEVRKKMSPAMAVSSNAIAIVGMASRTPGSSNLDEFWQNLLAGRNGIRHFAADEVDPSIPESIRNRPNFVAAHGVLDDVERFDAAFFGISAREATMVDPQQRLMLELCYGALEHAAIDPADKSARIGVYAGTGNNAYAAALRNEQPELIEKYGEFASMLASEKDYVATRVANRLNLTGPALSIHTACSTGLVAVAQAWQALAVGQCDVALAGGINVAVPQHGGYLHVEDGMESADGYCRPFDAQATGTVFASGGGVVALKRLEDAKADGNTIYAVIRGVGLNNDGGEKASFTAPSASAQAAAIRMALDQSGFDARSIGYVEAHGTGTALGDPIEVSALTRAWREDTADNEYCILGSVKGNVGHMTAGAGVVGLIKAALSLHQELIPGTLHFQKPNPQIDFKNSPFKVVASNTEWKRGQAPRRAAVSSFGVGGTNAHIVLEEAPERNAASVKTGPDLLVLPLSARTPELALRRAADLANYLESAPALRLADVAATLMRGRQPMPIRLSVVASSVAEAVVNLRSVKSSVSASKKPRLVYLFPGQGSQHPGMAGRLFHEAPAFREALNRCLAIVQREMGVDLGDWLIHSSPDDAQVAAQLAETRYAQPALFIMSYALLAWLDTLGLKPDAMIGHSIGEYAAACHAGVFSLEDALKAVIARGKAMFAQTPGAMLAVRATAEVIAPLLPAEVEIAGYNAPTLTVLAGSHTAIDRLASELESKDIGATRLRVSHAFHSASMEGAMAPVAEVMQGFALRGPDLRVYSCVTGAPLQATEAMDPGYWARQVRAPVQFTSALLAELAFEETVFVEVGPGHALGALVRQHRTPQGKVPRNIALLGPANGPGDAALHALGAIGALWCNGVDIAWPVAASAQRIALPTYPFAGERHWFERRRNPHATPPNSQDSSGTATRQPTVIPAAMNRIPTLENELKRILSDVSGLSADEMQTQATFVDLGLDSLSLTQATLELERVFGVKLRFRRLLEDLDSVGKLALFLDSQIPADKFAPVSQPVAGASAAVPMTVLAANYAYPVEPSGPMQQLIQQQLQLMSQQLALMSGQAPQALNTDFTGAVATPAGQNVRAASSLAAQTASVAPQTSPTDAISLIDKPFGASPRVTLDSKQALSPLQMEWLADFIARYNARSGKSKAFSQQHRKVMADPRVVTGFNPLWKDLVYPIVVDRSQGAHLWDLDGNEYIDLLSCFGGNLLGYQPPSVIAAMAEQLQLGLEVGPQHPLAAEVATLISDITGMERVGFCNTGSEAVMGAMRIARTVTGKKTIAIFTNSYHGIFDEVIVRGTKQLRSLSAAPGILANAVEHILVLDWNSEDSLRVLRERSSELAAIMTEPIQNKYPTIQPREFLHALRQIADTSGCALIFDEVVTGFRVAPGGAQEFYGVRADIVTYGKIIGGGLPFAAIAGASRWLDALDGGHWQYGDDSYPEAGVTYFAGTFVRHPLALAAARATLLHLKQGGPGLYRQLNGRTQRLIDLLNSELSKRGAPVQAVHCASLWRLQWDDNQRFISLFYYLVRHHGLHVYEQFGHFVTESMTDAHIDRIVKVFIDAVDELMALQFIAPRPGSPVPPSTPPRDDRAPTQAALSPGQTERWLAAAFDPAARRALNESFCVSLHGNVDVPALKAALADVLSRHDAFRLRFDQEEPLQILMPAQALPVADIDLTHQQDSDKALEDFAAQASLHDFRLDQAPLANVSMLKLADGRVVVHMVASHLVFDGWGSSVFNAELALAYKARSQGLAPVFKLAESPLKFANEEQARVEGVDGQEALRFWTDHLQNPPEPLNLGDRTPGLPRTYAADTQRMKIAGAQLDALRSQARQSGATLFQLLLTALTMMLQKRSGQSDFVISIPFASQSLKEHGPLVADGVLDLPLRVGCEPSDTPLTVLQRLRTGLLDALEHPVMTQGTVARALGIRSTGDRPPLTGVYFNMNPKVDLSAYAPLTATMHEGRKRGTLGELFFNFYDQGDALTLDLHYSSEWFSPQRAEELVLSLQNYCLAFAHSLQADSTPDPRILAWNAATTTHVELDARVEQWFSKQAAATPGALAVFARGSETTYAALEAQANQLANALKARSIGPGKLVGVCLSRGLEMVTSLLAILKTGAAYVPLDPGFPKERLQYMAEHSNVQLVITDANNAAQSAVERERQLRLDDDATAIAASADTAVSAPAGVSADDPAYVIYTSGSTGKPKGVVISQGAVCNFLASMRQSPGLKSSDRLLAVTTLSFDIAVLELFLPLVTGAAVILAQREDAMDGEALVRLIHDQRVNVMQATPTTWHMLLDANWKAPAGFKALCGGESLPQALATRLLDQGVELWNMYGPTETTVWSTLCRITDAQQKITIGRPIANTQAWILDEQLQPCPIGTEGELCLGGAGVALGYFNRPDLTAERFFKDPFSTQPGARLYRTGDLACWREDGLLEHRGRMDFQVKIRGYRIELGEIESRLGELPTVGRVVVIPREDTPGDVRLVAYVEPQTGSTPDAAQLRDKLRAVLPEYMVPQYIMAMPLLPLLPNGKIDRNALPAPVATAIAESKNGLAPRDALEQTLLSAMESVLKMSGLGVQDDFFAVGGHSLLAARLTSRLSRDLDIVLPMRVLFEAPTVEKLATAVRKVQDSKQPKRAPIVHDPQRTRAPLTPMQDRIRFVEELYPGRVVYNTPSCHRLTGPMDAALFELALRDVVQHQPVLRTVIRKPNANAGYEQEILPSVTFALPIVDLTHLPQAERETEAIRQMEETINTPMDIFAEPLFRVALYKIADDAHVFLFMPHHIIFDGWSFDIFYNEISSFYMARLAGNKANVADVPVTYADFAAWQAVWMQGPEFEAQRAYWTRRFDTAPFARALTPDHPRKSGMTGVGGADWIRIDSDLVETLRDVARGADATLNMLTMAVFAVMLSGVVRSQAVFIGLPVRSRSASEVDAVMGFFNNLLPVPLQPDAEMPFLKFIATVKRELLEIFSFQDIPFEEFVNDPAVAKHVQRAGLYQALFSFQDARERIRKWGQLDQKSILLFQKGATEDFGLWLMEVPYGIEGGVIYNSEMFDAQTASAFCTRYIELLQKIAKHPQLSIKDLFDPSDSEAGKYLMRLGRELDIPQTIKTPLVTHNTGSALSAEALALAQVWATVLEIDADQIRGEDNFFDLGGSSLLAMRAVENAHRELGLRIEAQRYIYESLRQLATPSSEKVPEPKRGTLSRLFANFSRK